MKWPSQLSLMRHGQSAYNVLREQKNNDKLFAYFKNQVKKNHRSLTTKILARVLKDRHGVSMGDWDTPLTALGFEQAYNTGLKLRYLGTDLPDIIYISPYKRTIQTYESLLRGWPELITVKTVLEERIREQEHGLATIYNDWDIFYAFFPEQYELATREGNYWYQNPQGENVPMVRQRVHSWIATLIREYNNQHVFAITHHLAILAARATLERWDHNNFIHHDKNDKPINCGITTYRGLPREGNSGRLVLENYNQKFYD